MKVCGCLVTEVVFCQSTLLLTFKGFCV